MKIELLALKNKLEIDNNSNIYILPNEFNKQMEATRSGYHLAAGLSSKEYHLLLKISGYRQILACPLKSEDDISIMEKL